MKLPTPIGLSQEKGVIGHILRQLPRPVLADAEMQNDPWTWLAKWVKKNPVEHWHPGTPEMCEAECAALEREGFERTGVGNYTATKKRPDAAVFQRVREVRFYSHKQASGKVSMRVIEDERWPDGFRKTFEAAVSQRKAFNVLAQRARGGGSISNHDLHLKILGAMKQGDKATVERLTKKHLASILRTTRGRRWLLENKEDGLSASREMREWAQRQYQSFCAADVSHLGRKKADEKWRSAATPQLKVGANDGDYIAAAMAIEWLSVGQNGFPGLCFMSDGLIAELLGRGLPIPALCDENKSGWKTVSVIRERLRLKKAITLFTGMEKIDGDWWVLLDRSGNKTPYRISFLKGRPLPQKL